MTPRPSREALGALRRLVVQSVESTLPEMVHTTLQSLRGVLDARAVFLARVDDETFQVIDAAGEGVARGLSMPLDQTFEAARRPRERVINVRDAATRDPFRGLPMRERMGVSSYLGVQVAGTAGNPVGTLAAIGKGARVFDDADADLLIVAAALLGARLEPGEASAREAALSSPLSTLRLASNEVKEPLAILKGYADMLGRNEVPAEQMPLVARRLAMQSETLIRIVDQAMILARVPLELAFTIRVSLDAVVRAAADRARGSLAARGMELRLQIDGYGEVWGDPGMLEAAIDEMLNNVFRHAPTATVVQLRLRSASPDRLQLIVKDDGPGISADRLAELFSPVMSDDPPRRGQGVGLHLLRRVAAAHGGSAWANSMEGKGSTFYLELPAASPDGESTRASQSIQARA